MGIYIKGMKMPKDDETIGKNFRIDCTSDGIFHIFNHRGFDVGHRLSSVEFIERLN